MRKWIIAVIILAALAGGGYFFYARWSAQQAAATLTNLQTQPAEKGELLATIGATGQVRSSQTAMLTWKTTGTVESVLVKVGDRVTAGQKLAQLSQTSLPQSVILAQADLVNAQTALEDLTTAAENAAVQALQSISTAAEAVKQAQYQLDNYTMPRELQGLSTMEAVDLMQKRLDAARSAFEPYKYLPSGDNTREDRLDDLNQAQADYNAAIKRLDYEYSVQVAVSQLEKARKDYEKYSAGPTAADIAAVQARIAAATSALTQAWIAAPFDGVVTLVDTMPGDQATMSAQAFRIDDLSVMLVDLSVSEVDINQVQPGQEVSLSFDAVRNKEYHGVVRSVDRVGTLISGAIEFIVTVELTDPDEAVRPGMTAAVSIVVTRLEDVLLVPNRAVRYVDGEQTVFVLRGTEIIPVTVTLGAASEVSSEILGGELAAGDLIVLNPPAMLVSGGQPGMMMGRP